VCTLTIGQLKGNAVPICSIEWCHSQSLHLKQKSANLKDVIVILYLFISISFCTVWLYPGVCHCVQQSYNQSQTR